MATKMERVEPLTAEQSLLVRDNIGLVAVHLRRRVSNIAAPHRDRERDDLFQEGCLGLMQAARRFRRERGIPFAAFALPRIHNAVSKALRTKFSLIRCPTTRSVNESGADAFDRSCDASPMPMVRSMSEEIERRIVAPLRDEKSTGRGETIGDRLRRKYEDAVEKAGRLAAGKTSTRGDRADLVRILTRERFLVPHEEARRSLRQIGRDTRSSYARVAQCDKQIGESIRRTLDDDPEFRELRRRTRTNPLGCEMPIDDEVERALVTASTDEFARRFRCADPQRRARALQTLLETSRGDIESLVRSRFTQLSKPMRDQLLEDTVAPRLKTCPRRRCASSDETVSGLRRKRHQPACGNEQPGAYA